MVFGVFAFLAALTLPVALPVASAPPGPRLVRRAPTSPAEPERRRERMSARHGRAVRTLRDLPAGDLYSARARRRVAAYLRLRLLELRKMGLERAADVVERRLPVEELLRRR
jgi:hypothetical protein